MTRTSIVLATLNAGLEAEMTASRTRISTGELQRVLGLTRGRLERILRDWARELPEPEIIAGSRTWAVDSVQTFQSVLARDKELLK